ncbi:MAG: PhzF family phenazine biosynthesis protein [Opitutales bacterium]|nr:PhzF family phenazine biosynthesis protein [Opitutales bacterium]
MQKKIPVYQIDAFAEGLFTGNPAAVCPLEDWLPDSVLQCIAAENNLSETAFYTDTGGDYDLRWFTPQKEVDLCGHATLAAAYVVFARGGGAGGALTFRSRSGPLQVSRDGDSLTLDFPAQPGAPCEPPGGLAEALGAAPQECFRAADYMAVYEDAAAVAALRPDLRRLAEIDTRGVIVTAPGNNCDFVSRFFAPRYGVDEDPVTGSAHCTLTPYWVHRLNKSVLEARQLSKRGGRLRCRAEGNRVHISGKAVPYMEGTLRTGL